MVRLERFTAVRYRGIDGLDLPLLTRANLITGANGVGKTALIEAMWLFVGRYNPSLLWNANVQRSRVPPLDPISRLTGGALTLRGKECGTKQEVGFIFEKINDVSSEGAIVRSLQGNTEKLSPVMGLIRTYLDGNP